MFGWDGVDPVLSVLGGQAVLGASAASIRTLRQLQEGLTADDGLPFGAFLATAKAIAMKEREVREIVGIPKRTFERRKEAKRLERFESERLVNLARAIAAARDVFGNEEKARRWLTSESRALAARPIDLVSSTIGLETVLAELGKIEHGIFA